MFLEEYRGGKNKSQWSQLVDLQFHLRNGLCVKLSKINWMSSEVMERSEFAEKCRKQDGWKEQRHTGKYNLKKI